MTSVPFPIEIWKEIFGHLDKSDIKECLLVCRSWNQLAHPLLGDSFYLKLHDSYFNILLADLATYPTFGPKVTHITIPFGSTNVGNPETLRSIINHCPNLLELRFDNSNPYEYLKALNCKEANLPCIQAIKLRNHMACSPAVRRFHLWVNYRFRSTIQTIDIMDVDENGALENYGGLVKYVASFPNLNELRAYCDIILKEDVNVIHLTDLLTHAKNLKVLRLNHFSKIIDTPDESSPSTLVTDLELGVLRLDIKAIQYVLANFKNLTQFRLTANSIESDRSLGQELSDNAVNELHAFAKRIDRYYINYDYKGKHFFEKNIMECPTYNPVNDPLLQDIVDYFENDTDWLYDFDEGSDALNYFNHLDYEDALHHDDSLENGLLNDGQYLSDEFDTVQDFLGYEDDYDDLFGSDGVYMSDSEDVVQALLAHGEFIHEFRDDNFQDEYSW
ncbi:MAG: hypothetical protein EXX96DRAFT_549562 [Benjaminiella poitrasii]|nr:MAG: hypothetical protein EXX96DRAFT_549562 [Benjaminiella poitrasii]